jgi:hypothetical protein
MKAFLEKKSKIRSGEIRMCTRCIYDETVPNIIFDEKGVCNYCYQIDDMEKMYQTGTPQAEQNLQKMIEQVKKDGKGKKYDCVIGVSGGTDSSYLVHKMVKEWGLRPLAVHYDSTWNTGISTENIRKMLSKLNVDFSTEKSEMKFNLKHYVYFSYSIFNAFRHHSFFSVRKNFLHFQLSILNSQLKKLSAQFSPIVNLKIIF